MQQSHRDSFFLQYDWICAPLPAWRSVFAAPVLKMSWVRDEKIQMPSLKPSQSEEHTQRKHFSLLFPAPSTTEARVKAPARVRTGGYTFKGPPQVGGTGGCRGPHQRAVLSPPAWKLFSDKRTGSSKGVRRQASAAKMRTGMRAGRVGGHGDRQTDGREGRIGSGGLLGWPF